MTIERERDTLQEIGAGECPRSARGTAQLDPCTCGFKFAQERDRELSLGGDWDPYILAMITRIVAIFTRCRKGDTIETYYLFFQTKIKCAPAQD